MNLRIPKEIAEDISEETPERISHGIPGIPKEILVRISEGAFEEIQEWISEIIHGRTSAGISEVILGEIFGSIPEWIPSVISSTTMVKSELVLLMASNVCKKKILARFLRKMLPSIPL